MNKVIRALVIRCQICDKELSVECLIDYFNRTSKIESALRDLITIIEFDELDPSPNPMLKIPAREIALQNAKELLPEVYEGRSQEEGKIWRE